MFGIPEQEIKKTLAEVDRTLAEARSGIAQLDILLKRITQIVELLETKGVTITIKPGTDQ